MKKAFSIIFLLLLLVPAMVWLIERDSGPNTKGKKPTPPKPYGNALLTVDYYRSFDQYFNLTDDTGILKLEELEYKRDIQLIEHFFPSKPLILFHEELVKNPSRVISCLAEYIGITYDEKDIHFNPINVAFTQKQLKAIRLFNTIFRYTPSKNRIPAIRRIHKNMRKLAVHTVGFLSLGFPDFLIKNKTPLIPPEKLTQIRERFAEDWQYCLNYARNQRELFL